MPKTGVGMTVDQIAARHLGKDTSLPSLELCAEPGGMISFRTPNQPLPMENNPRKVFYGMFGQGDTKEERQAHPEVDGQPARLRAGIDRQPEPKLDAGDRARVNDYLDSVREIERRVQRLEENAQSLRSARRAARSAGGFRRAARHAVRDDRAGLPDEPDPGGDDEDGRGSEHADVSEPGVHEAFHPTSHWGGFPERVANLRIIQNYHTAVFAKFVKRLKDMREGDGSVLDQSIILFGSNMANSDAHNNDPLPQALIGRGGGVKGNQHLHYPQDTPHANILVTMLDRAGVPARTSRSSPTTPGFSEV